MYKKKNFFFYLKISEMSDSVIVELIKQQTVPELQIQTARRAENNTWEYFFSYYCYIRKIGDLYEEEPYHSKQHSLDKRI